MFLKDLYAVNPKLANEFEFKFNKMESLFDPINALKIEALLVWGYIQLTANQMSWWSTLTHWGLTRIAPYYYYKKNDGILPDNYTFNKGTINEDVRDPLQYFGLFYANWANFSKFRIKVGVETYYDEIYRKTCSKLEWQFIQSWKYVKDLKDDVEELKKFKLDVTKEYEKKINKYLKKTSKIDQKYRELSGLIKTGKFNKIKDVLIMWKSHFKELADDLTAEKEAKHKKIVLVIYFIIVGITILFAIMGFLFLIYYLWSKKK